MPALVIIPDAVIDTTLAVPVIPKLTFALATIVTLLLPLVILVVLKPVNADPLPIKKLALKLPLVSLSAIVLAVFAEAGALPCNALAFKFATTVVDVTTSGAVPVAIVEIS